MSEQLNTAKLVHRGFSFQRTQLVQEFRDTAREKSLAEAWELENPAPGQFGNQPILNALVPDCSQRDAQVAATVVQWLGSQVGFQFLQEALGKVGYQIVELKNPTP
jgi:hypothetical protein